MSCAQLYFGDKDFCITIKKNEDVTNAEFLVLDEDDVAQDIDGTEHKITVYETPYGVELYTKALTQVTNSLKWTYKWADIDLTQGNRYHEISFVDSSGDEKIVGFGTFQII
jgi:hypothetical protein